LALQPFPADRPLPSFELTGGLNRRGPRLTLTYTLRGDLAGLTLPAPAAAPARRHGLWQATCFECFLAPCNFPGYWEFNLSPAGYWNVYHLAAYRQGLHEDAAITSLPFAVQRQANVLRLALECDLARIIPASQALEAALAAVLQLRDGSLTYWALTHPGPEPDFHRRDSFIIRL
jgi:hypothetical protein